MKRRQRLLLITIAALLSSAASVIPRVRGEASAQSVTNKSSVLLGQVADEVWQRKLKSPAARLEQGLPIDELPRWSAANAEAEAAFSRDVLKKLEAVNEQELSHEESLTLAVVRWDARNAIEGARHFWLRSPVTPYASYLPAAHRIFQTFRFERAADAERYLDLLGRELGQYQDLYDLYGHLSMEMMISVRLVVDTGMNHLKWSRGRAMEFMRSRTLHSDTEIATETLRYSADIPGQALAYKMGQIRILELREAARKSLGDKFDIRRFHQVVLGSGALPMTVLERHVNWSMDQDRNR